MSTGFSDSTRGDHAQRLSIVPSSGTSGARQRRQLSFLLNNDPEAIALVVEQLCRQLASVLAGDEQSRFAVAMAMEEALANALYHGNLEISSKLREGDGSAFYELARERRQQQPFCRRRISVHASIRRHEALFVVRDDGPGFDTSGLPDPRDEQHLAKPSGRGVLLMRHLMDEVRFNSRGNEVTMTKRFDRD